MSEQQSGLGQTVIQRKSLAPGRGDSYQQPQASKHRAGHYAGLQPEEVDPEDLEEDERYYVTRPHTSARRYNTPDGYIVRQGNKTFRYRGSLPQPPKRRSSIDEEEQPQPKRRRSTHWLVWVGIALLIMILGWIAFTSLGSWVQAKEDDWTYGQNPRRYDIDAVVGHSDSSSSPTHFIGMNLRGTIIVIELPGGDASKARSYTITTVPGNDSYPPVKLSFQDINHDGKLDMLIQIGDPGSVVTIMLFNNGSQFVSKL